MYIWDHPAMYGKDQSQKTVYILIIVEMWVYIFDPISGDI